MPLKLTYCFRLLVAAVLVAPALLAFHAARTAHAETGRVIGSISLVRSAATIQPGSVFTVSVVVAPEPGSSLSSAVFNVAFDRTRLAVDLFECPETVTCSEDPETGDLTFGMEFTEPVTSSRTVLVLPFRGTGFGVAAISLRPTEGEFAACVNTEGEYDACALYGTSVRIGSSAAPGTGAFKMFVPFAARAD